MIDILNINYINILAIVLILAFFALIIYLFTNKIKYNSQNVDKYVNSLKKEKIKVKDYEIIKYYDVLTDDECNCIIKNSKKDLKESVVYKDGFTKKEIDPDVRISKTAWLDKDSTKEIELRKTIDKLENIASFITKLPVVNQEQIQVVNYEKGGYYNPHYDACNAPDIDSKINMNGSTGQRVYTFLIYLNDNLRGGSTYFPKIDKYIEPKKGMGILFRNINYNNNDFHELAEHTGTVIKKGEKWICNIWVHENNYRNNKNTQLCYCPNCTNTECYNVAKLKGETECKLKECLNEKCPNFFPKTIDCLCPYCENIYCKSKLRNECIKPNCMNINCPKGKINIENMKKAGQ
tara:strand:+ start:132 stop:1178 length:1047 start_codon:yes stop_codon:yes gene_type:complete